MPDKPDPIKEAVRTVTGCIVMAATIMVALALIAACAYTAPKAIL